MERREALNLLGAAALTSLLTPLSACQRTDLGAALHARLAAGQAGQALSGDQLALVGAIADTIIPRTDTPGATDVGVPAFIDLLLAEWYSDEEREESLDGLEALGARCREKTGAAFTSLGASAREAFVGSLDGRTGEKPSAEWAYHRVKDLTVYGYFTSREVQVNVLKTPIIPGRFDGCVPMPGR